jgi:porin
MAVGKSRQFWMRGSLFAICSICTVPAKAQTNPGLLGDMGGLRGALGKAGITLNVTDDENLLGNLAGGVAQGSTLQGVTTGTLEIDTGKASGPQGGTVHISALQIHGRSLSPYYLDNLQTANGNEAEDTTRLWELWYDQALDYGRADIKLGQQSIDNEFIVSRYSGLFVNTMAGWPLIPSDDLYGGGPAYPLSSLGARLQGKPSNNTTILAGAFDDNPGGGAFNSDAQALDRTGGKFNLNTGALFIAELQYAVNEPAVGQAVQPNQPPPSGLPGTYKIGFWYDTGVFPDQRFGADGLSLANPRSDGKPRMHKGDYSVYGVVDQTFWQSASDASRNLNLFGRIMMAPDDRNLIDFSFSGGLTLAALLPGRDNDQAGIDVGVGRVSGRAAGLDRDQGTIMRGVETLVELTYQAQVTPWLQLQPDFQYVINPGAGLVSPGEEARQVQNEFVGGIRVVTAF